MKAEKKVIGSLNKCYACATYEYDGVSHLIVAAEKTDPCYSFTMDGEMADTLWEGPGGVMTLLQFHGNEDVLMATQKFYSPNDSAEAKIVYYTKDGNQWNCHVLCDLPFVHRFGIIENHTGKYLIACTLKSAHAFKNDWTCPGRIWCAKLPESLLEFNEDHQLQLTPLVSGLYKNHGFAVHENGDGSSFAVVGTENGVYMVCPPENAGEECIAKCLLETPASDVLYLDFDNDNERELLVLSPFHGDTLSVYKKNEGAFEKVYEREEKMPFIHAIYGACVKGRNVAFIGNRQEAKQLIALEYQDGSYHVSVLDQGAGPANCMYYSYNGKDMLLAANRETDEIALYELCEE